MNQLTLQPKIHKQWIEIKQSEDAYFIKAEIRRSMWFDFFCINPLNSKIPELTYAQQPRTKSPSSTTVIAS